MADETETVIGTWPETVAPFTGVTKLTTGLVMPPVTFTVMELSLEIPAEVLASARNVCEPFHAFVASHVTV